MAYCKMLLLYHYWFYFKEHHKGDKAWLVTLPPIFALITFTLWTITAGLALHYDGKDIGVVLGTTLGACLGVALVTWGLLYWMDQSGDDPMGGMIEPDLKQDRATVVLPGEDVENLPVGRVMAVMKPRLLL